MIRLRATLLPGIPGEPLIIQRLSEAFDLASARSRIDEAITSKGKLVMLKDDGISLLELETRHCQTIAIVDESALPEGAEELA